MEAREWAYFLLEIRRSLLKLFAIITIVSFSFFPFSSILISFIVEEMFPYKKLSHEEVEEISEVLREVAEKIAANKDNTTFVAEELKALSRTLVSFMGPVVLTPIEALVLSLKMSIAIGIAASIRYLLLILSRTLKTRGWLKVSVKYYAIASTFLFAIGCLYGFFIVRLIVAFLHSLTVAYGVTPLYSLSDFVTFVLFLIALFGFFFEIPIIMIFLVRNRVVSYETLKYYRRHSYVLFFIIAAIATPTVDIFTQTMLALPMIVLFELGLVLAKLFS
ncbi:MAG: twin-arginine translocase subunit TatC [Archaeoglobaceae archaeon]